MESPLRELEPGPVLCFVQNNSLCDPVRIRMIDPTWRIFSQSWRPERWMRFLSDLNWLVSFSSLGMNGNDQRSSSETWVALPALAALIAASVLALARGKAMGKPPVSTTLRSCARVSVGKRLLQAATGLITSRFGWLPRCDEGVPH